MLIFSQAIPRILWNMKVHDRVHNSSPFFPNPRHSGFCHEEECSSCISTKCILHLIQIWRLVQRTSRIHLLPMNEAATSTLRVSVWLLHTEVRTLGSVFAHVTTARNVIKLPCCMMCVKHVRQDESLQRSHHTLRYPRKHTLVETQTEEILTL